MFSLLLRNSRSFSLLRRTEAGNFVKSSFSCSAKAARFYELRNYDIKPKYFGEFVKVAEESNFGAIAPDVKCLGFWTVEYGDLCQVVSMLEFDNHTERNAIKEALYNLPEWMGFMMKVAHTFVKQENVILHAFPWYDVVEKPILQQGVYELRRCSVLPGKVEQFAHRFQQAIDDRSKYSQLLGIWYSEFGKLNQVYHLWHYRSIDERDAIRAQANKDEMWREAIRDCTLLLTESESKLMIPTSFSLWQ